MERKRLLIVGGAGAAAIAAIAAAAFALAPEHRGRLAALDLDNDGRIVRVEVQQSARTRFAALDANRDGRLTAEEMPRGRGHGGHGGHGGDGLGRGGREATADRNGDGAVSLAEFYLQLRTRAARADANGDGIVSAAELAADRPRRGRHWG